MKITQDLLKELLHYDADTGVFTWRERDARHFATLRGLATWNARYAGKRAGSEHSLADGYKYRSIRIGKSKLYKEHRLAFLYQTGSMPDTDIDHLNRDATDNRWCNIRTVNRATNCQNRSKRMDNSSGVTGVSWSQSANAWRARGTCNGVATHLGYFTEIDEAAMEVLEFRADRGFSRDHGLEIAHYHAGAIA